MPLYKCNLDNLVIAAPAQWTKILLFFIFPDSFHAKNVLIRNTEQYKAADLRLVTPKTCKISKREIFIFLVLGVSSLRSTALIAVQFSDDKRQKSREYIFIFDHKISRDPTFSNSLASLVPKI